MSKKQKNRAGKEVITIIVLFIAGIILMSGCIGEKTGTPEKVTVTEEGYKIVTDARGKEVKIPEDPKRVIPMSQGLIDQTMVSFGIADKIVGYGSCGQIKDTDTSGYLAINDT
ncbi:MAG: hypothetical protein U9Q22_07480, partial [Candidatus Altiarchaeota archaeon]|nr:hypothetical protein [Candidatus Altiarchaeota archaeon]